MSSKFHILIMYTTDDAMETVPRCSASQQTVRLFIDTNVTKRLQRTETVISFHFQFVVRRIRLKSPIRPWLSHWKP